MIADGEIAHIVDVQYAAGQAPAAAAHKELIRKAVKETLQYEKADMLCVVNVLVTDDVEIREYNREYRDIDSATDVLSFPMQNFLKAGWDGLFDAELDKDTGDLPLGDIVISSKKVEMQAEEYGNTVEYESAYLIIHSTLHLLGYDQDNEADEKKLHEKNKAIIEEMGLSINDN